MARYYEFHLRIDSTLNWTASNPRLGLGEPGIDITKHRFKVGNGIDRWNELPYIDDEAYDLLDEYSREIADQIRAIQHRIENDELTFEQGLNELEQELRKQKRTFTTRMDSLESEQARYETEIDGTVSGMRTELDAGLEEFGKTRDHLNTRMDVIAGSATEDTEILDARVDADSTVHPNIGHNIRSLHADLSREKQLRREGDEFQQEQADTNASTLLRLTYEVMRVGAAVSDSVSGLEGLEAELKQECTDRETAEAELTAKLKQETTERQRENESLKTETETLSRLHAEREDFLQAQTDENAYASLSLAYQLSRKSESSGQPSEQQAGDILSWNEDMLPAVNASCRYGAGGTTKQFAMLCMMDTHYQAARLRAGIKYLNGTAALDCGCCIGDMQNNFTQSNAEWYAEAVRQSTKPFYTVIGNHELGSGSIHVIEATNEAVFEKYIAPVSGKTGISGLTKAYYRADWNKYGITLIVLNGHNLPEDVNSSGEYEYAQSSKIYYGQEQIDWLIQELGAIPKENSLIVMAHMRDFEMKIIANEFSSREAGTVYASPSCYGQHGVVQDIIEAWRTGGKLEREYVPEYAKSVSETLKVNCDYRERGTGDFICWLCGHHHRDLIGRSTKYPSQLVIHLCATAGKARNSASGLPNVAGTKSEDVITVLSADKVSRTVRLVRIGSNITTDLRERKMTSIPWDYTAPEPDALGRQAELRRESEEFMQEQVDQLAGAMLKRLLEYREQEVRTNERLRLLEGLVDELLEGGALEYKGAQITRNSEMNDMMDDVFDGDGSGGIEMSTIPEELADEVSSQEDFADMLDEIFS